MKSPEIYKKWTNFINDTKYKKYFLSNEDIWNANLEKVKRYIDGNKKRPCNRDKNNDTKQLGIWFSHQMTYYEKKEYIIKFQEIRNKWTDFINNTKYKKYFLSNEDAWDTNLEKAKKYIDDNHRRPSTIDKNNDTRQLGRWLSHQTTNYKKKMRDEII